MRVLERAADCLHLAELSDRPRERVALIQAGCTGYEVTLAPIGPDDREVGPPTQLAVFTR